MTACLVALASAISWGQRGGGFHGGAGFASRSGMHAGGFHGAGRASFAGAPRSNFRRGNTFHHPNHGPTFIIQHRRFDARFRGGLYAGYPLSYGGYGYPFYWDWEDSSYNSQDNDSYAQYQAATEINRLADEVQELREERQYLQRPPEPRPSDALQPRPEAKLQEDLPVVLVFLDKRIQEVRNYAVANEMLVVLDGNRRKKYPLADIDLAATMRLNDERGVDFQVPNPVMTQ
ncbi:MAG: hypothetical protein WA628_06160 [Terriglobales bacterium]